VVEETQITFSWSDGIEDGGSAVIDYKISYSENGSTYSTLETGITIQSYTAISLTPGNIYGLKVSSRNSFGYSALSKEVLITAA
jgi:hypothetical protein